MTYSELFEKVKAHMGWDDRKTKTWFHSENPLLGGAKPYNLYALRPEKTCKVILAMIEENTAPKEKS